MGGIFCIACRKGRAKPDANQDQISNYSVEVIGGRVAEINTKDFECFFTLNVGLFFCVATQVLVKLINKIKKA